MSEQTAAASLSHHFTLVVDNDYGSYLAIQELVAQAREDEYPTATLADMLREFAEETLGLESDDNGLRLELLSTALSWIDWHAMAADYLSES